MENKTPIIRMDGLGKAFTGSQGTVRALEGISLEILSLIHISEPTRH